MVNCSADSTLGVCDLIDEAGTGMAVLADRIALPLGTLVLIFVVIAGVASFIGAIVAVITGSIKRAKIK